MKYERIIKGDLIIKKQDNFENVIEIKGDLILKVDIKISLPNCSSVGGWVKAWENAKISLPNCSSVGGWVKAWENAKISLPNCSRVGGTVKAWGNAKISLPKEYKYNDNNARHYALKFNFECFLKAGFLFADGILAKILEYKKNVYKIQICGQTKISFCIEKDGIFSHGDTIKQAKESLIYKISNRDTSKYKNYTLDTIVTFEEAIQMYRCITGACEAGTKHFVENVLKVKKKKYTIKEVIELTKGQYNNALLIEFFS